VVAVVVVVVAALAVEADAMCRVVRALAVFTVRGVATVAFTEAAAELVRCASPSQPTMSAVAPAAATPTVQVARRTSLSAVVRSVMGGCSVISRTGDTTGFGARCARPGSAL
jgi:hypothetical protein